MLVRNSCSGQQLEELCRAGEGLVPVLGHSLVVGAASPVPRTAAWLRSPSGVWAPVSEPSAAGPLCYVSRGKDQVRDCSGFEATWPEKQGQSFNLAQFLSLVGHAAQGMQWYEQRGKDGLLLKEMIIKLYQKICILQVCFTFSYCDLLFLLPKRNDFSILFTVLPCWAKSLFPWKLIYPLSILIFVRVILEMFYFIISQLRTIVTLCYKAPNYSVSDL